MSRDFRTRAQNPLSSAALDKATHYFSEDHDISITVQQLLELPNGGHRATLEVHITPLSLRNTAHIKGADIELKRDHNKAFLDERIKENETLHILFMIIFHRHPTQYHRAPSPVATN